MKQKPGKKQEMKRDWSQLGFHLIHLIMLDTIWHGERYAIVLHKRLHGET